jgi:hypothetical protein
VGLGRPAKLLRHLQRLTLMPRGLIKPPFSGGCSGTDLVHGGIHVDFAHDLA